MRRIVVLVVAGVGLAAAKERKRRDTATAQTRIGLTQAARQPMLTTDDVERLLAEEHLPVAPKGLVIVERTEYQVEDPGGSVGAVLRQNFFEPQPVYQPRYYSYSDDGPIGLCPCGEDVDRYCSRTDDDMFAYIFYQYPLSVFEKRLCLGDHFDQLSEQCAAHLASTPTVVEYCRGEILETCRDVQPGENRVHECLLDRLTVGDACDSYLQALATPKAMYDDWKWHEPEFQGVEDMVRPPPREVAVESEAEEEDAALVDEEATAAASLLVLASAAALCLASLSLAVLALGVARRRAREREELAAFKANYAPMLSENEQA